MADTFPITKDQLNAVLPQVDAGKELTNQRVLGVIRALVIALLGASLIATPPGFAPHAKFDGQITFASLTAAVLIGSVGISLIHSHHYRMIQQVQEGGDDPVTAEQLHECSRLAPDPVKSLATKHLNPTQFRRIFHQELWCHCGARQDNRTFRRN